MFPGIQGFIPWHPGLARCVVGPLVAWWTKWASFRLPGAGLGGDGDVGTWWYHGEKHCWYISSGKHTKSYWKRWLIVDLPINSMVIFHSYVKVYQRVVGITSTKQDPVGRLGFPNGIFAWPRIWHWEWPTFVAPLFRFAHSIWPKKWSSKSKKGIRPLRGLALMDSIKLQFHHVSFSFRATLITLPVYQSED